MALTAGSYYQCNRLCGGWISEKLTWSRTWCTFSLYLFVFVFISDVWKSDTQLLLFIMSAFLDKHLLNKHLVVIQLWEL